MGSWHDVHVLEHRALQAYALAARLQVSVLHALHDLGGPGTWVGPSADAFSADAELARRVLDEVVLDTRRAAHRLRSDAAALAATLRAAEAVAGAS